MRNLDKYSVKMKEDEVSHLHLLNYQCTARIEKYQGNSINYSCDVT